MPDSYQERSGRKRENPGYLDPSDFPDPVQKSDDDDPEVVRGPGNGDEVPNETLPEALLLPSLLFTRSVTVNVPPPGYV
jgi:hypothetical protein